MDQDVIWDVFQNELSDTFRDSRYRLEFLVRRLRSGSRVLDVGVGDGSLVKLAIAKSVDIHALDPSERSIEALRATYRLGDRARAGRIEQIPFNSDSFDAVIVSEVLEHLTDEVLAAGLMEIHRVLRRGGEILGTVPARERLEDQTVVCPCCGNRFHRWGHVQSFHAERMRDVLSPPFEVLEVYERCFWNPSQFSLKERLEYAVKQFLWDRGFHRIGDALFFRARKR